MTVDPLIRVRPPDVPEAEWRTTVGRTRSMLAMLAGSDRLDSAGVEALRRDLTSRVASARPETALDVVVDIWSAIQDRAGPAIVRAERPDRIELALLVEPLGKVQPPDVDPAARAEARSRTRSMLEALAVSGTLDDSTRAGLRIRWTDAVAEALLRPSRAKDALRQVWEDAEKRSPGLPGGRPALLRGGQKGEAR